MATPSNPNSVPLDDKKKNRLSSFGRKITHNIRKEKEKENGVGGATTGSPGLPPTNAFGAPPPPPTSGNGESTAGGRSLSGSGGSIHARFPAQGGSPLQGSGSMNNQRGPQQIQKNLSSPNLSQQMLTPNPRPQSSNIGAVSLNGGVAVPVGERKTPGGPPMRDPNPNSPSPGGGAPLKGFKARLSALPPPPPSPEEQAGNSPTKGSPVVDKKPFIPRRQGRGSNVDVDSSVFSMPDSDDNLRFTDKDDTDTAAVQGGPKPIKGGTLAKLVERLTYPQYSDPDFFAAFLLTYRSFTTPHELLQYLVLRYNMSAAGDPTKEKELQTIRLRISNVLNGWLKNYFYDFEDPALVDSIRDFFETMKKGGIVMEKASDQLHKLLDRQLEQQKSAKDRTHIFSKPPPNPILPVVPAGKPLTLMDIHPEELARQLTLHEYELYKSIKPWECLGQAWSKDKKEELSPNILQMIKRFNDVSSWVVTEIVSAEEETDRVIVMQRFIEVAKQCKLLNNFNACMEIISGLTNSSIYRLKKEWDILPGKINETFQSLHSVMSREKNYQNFRQYLHSVDPPCIPYLGVYLTDLTFIEDGNPDRLEGGLINFVKRRKVANVIREVQQYQQSPYNLSSVPSISDYLNDLSIKNNDECYNRSLVIIPRGATGKMAPKELKEAKAKLKKKVKELEKEEANKYTSSPAAGAKPQEQEFDLEFREGYRFYSPDIEGTNIVLLPNPESGTGKDLIKCATIEKLVERLTYEKYPDTKLMSNFLLTYRSFISSHELIDLLTMRYSIPPPKNPTPQIMEEFHNKKEFPIQLRVVNVCKTWVSKYWYDFDDPKLVEKFMEFLDHIAKSQDMKSGALALKDKVQKLHEGGAVKLENSYEVESSEKKSAPSPILPDHIKQEYTLMEINPEELARQITLIEQSLIKEIKPWELLYYTKPENQSSARHVKLFEDHINTLRKWVQSEIVKCSLPKDRSVIIGHIIKTIEKCSVLNNFNAVHELVTALEVPSIKSLNDAWKFVPGRLSQQYEFFQSQVNSWKQISKFQEKLQQVVPPSIPCIGVYLEELTRIENNLPDKVGDLINFEKCRQIGTIIGELQQCQLTPYCLEPVNEIQAIFKKVVWTQKKIDESAKNPPMGVLQTVPIHASPEVEQRQSIPPVNTPPLRPERPMSTYSALSKVAPNIPPKRRSSSSESGADAEGIKTSIINALGDDETFKNNLKEALLGEIKAEVNTLKQQISHIMRGSPDQGVEDLVKARFATPPKVWQSRDKEGVVYGWPDDVRLHYAQWENVVIHKVNFCDKADIATALRLKDLYEKSVNKAVSKLVIVANYVSDTARQAAKTQDIEIVSK